MLIGVGFKLKDKRVDRFLHSKGFDGADIYYSPISTWILLLALLIPGGFGLLSAFVSSIYSLFLIPYFLISYLLNAYKSTSFAFHEDKLIAVNQNFPFRKMSVINTKDIVLVTIDKLRRKWTLIFLDVGENYLSVQTKNKCYKFYCSGLDLDGFDENWTEKTIDDLHIKLKEKGIPTEFKLDC